MCSGMRRVVGTGRAAAVGWWTGRVLGNFSQRSCSLTPAPSLDQQAHTSWIHGRHCTSGPVPVRCRLRWRGPRGQGPSPELYYINFFLTHRWRVAPLPPGCVCNALHSGRSGAGRHRARARPSLGAPNLRLGCPPSSAAAAQPAAGRGGGAPSLLRCCVSCPRGGSARFRAARAPFGSRGRGGGPEDSDGVGASLRQR